jgi:dihydrofolate reductase
MRELVLIAAMTRNRCLGLNGQMPWPKPPDGKHFVATTMGHAVLMGRKTWASIGRPLPGRRNLVLSRDRALRLDGAEVFADFQAMLTAAWSADDAPRIIGGGELYRMALPLATRCVLSELPEHCDGDTFFPELDEAWRETARDDQGRYVVRTFERATARS